MTITLILAWCLVGVRSSAFIPSNPNLLKAHMDYLLMTGLLMFLGTRPLGVSLFLNEALPQAFLLHK